MNNKDYPIFTITPADLDDAVEEIRMSDPNYWEYALIVKLIKFNLFPFLCILSMEAKDNEGRDKDVLFVWTSIQTACFQATRSYAYSDWKW